MRTYSNPSPLLSRLPYLVEGVSDELHVHLVQILLVDAVNEVVGCRIFSYYLEIKERKNQT